MEIFKLKEGEEYIELNNLIKALGWVITGGEAKIRIDEGEVSVNGEVETRRRKKVRAGETVAYGEDMAVVEAGTKS
ncbi:RNA-binding S4 domain-containing protein [Reichenbachiella agarivorans]|uniref:RNA-binding S4 domain-containing protein n=1 Tax=Reichenbachiella agarivorans TaxID=2979464 RepID=A0ABY6CS89_9BACT|nr:RNA-binding S4 domain-containing protein [Reichenbachiella agarivorans]UXP31155.1 RNA-binding S4 domain-containing protein [Reichenbachiella agarivorans]